MITYRAGQFLVAAVFMTFGLSEMLSGHRDGYSISPLLYYGAAGFEVVIAILFGLGYGRVASVLGMVFSVVAIGFAVMHPKGDCGCLASIGGLSPRLRVAVAGALGLLCAVLYCRLVVRQAQLVSSAPDE